MKAKRILFAALTVALTVGLCQQPASAEATWTKEPADWAIEQMEDLADLGIFTSEISPTRIISRGQFCGYMVSVIQREGQRELLQAVPPMPLNYFDDVPSTTGYGGSYNVYTAAAYGLTEGALVDGKRLADNKNNLTREQAAKMMCALLDALERYTGMEQEDAGTPRTFVDADSISPWAKEYVDRASALEILKGDEAGRFNPQGILTFQEAAVMLDRAALAAEKAAVARDAALGIRSLKTGMAEDADNGLGDAMTQMYWLKNGSVLNIHGKESVQAGIAFQDRGVWVESFDGNGNSTGVREIPSELEYCAGFYEGEDAYYLAFGQDNMEENDAKEVYRIVRYDKNWNRLGAASVTGGESYTTESFHSTTHTGMAEEDGTLVLHTARLRYLTPSDGLRHQSNITIKVRTSDMKVLSVSPTFPGNHVSHSFAQYVAFDNGLPVYVDQGDAYPRGFTLNVEDGKGNSQAMNFFPFSGELGDNNTYAFPGGFGISADNYLFAGSSSPQNGNDSKTYANVFLAVVPKEGYPKGEVSVKWLTGFPQDEQEYVRAVWLVPVNNNTFVVMWQSDQKDVQTPMGNLGEFRYAVFDGEGNQIGKTQVMENYAVPLNDPTVVGNRIVWVRPEIGPYGVFNNSSTRHLKVYELEVDLNDPTEVTAQPQQPEVVQPEPTTQPDITTQPGTTTQPGSTTQPGTTTTQPGTGTQPGTTGTGSGSSTLTGYRNPVSTELPADGRVDYYRCDWAFENWMEVEILNGDTIRFSGYVADLPSYYNYVVVQVVGDQYEVPLAVNQPFTVEGKIDVDKLNRSYGGDVSKATSIVTTLLCQNHKPGSTNLAGMSFPDAPRITLALDGEGGCTLQVVK